jgi:hypothetical protein
VKAIGIDDEQTVHLMIGLTEDDVLNLVNGERIVFDVGIDLTAKSKVLIVVAGTDEELVSTLPERFDLSGTD